MLEKNSKVYINHIFFVHSSIDGHPGWFCCYTIVCSAAVVIDICALCSVDVKSLGQCAGMA